VSSVGAIVTTARTSLMKVLYLHVKIAEHATRRFFSVLLTLDVIQSFWELREHKLA